MRRKHYPSVLAVVACIGMVLPPQVLAAEATSRQNDVALRPGGMLVGQVVDAQGVVQPEKTISIQYGEQEVVCTTTDRSGVFAARGLRGGQYRVVMDDGECYCRLWAENTAPPAAHDALVVVSDQNVVRGQWGDCNSPCGPGYGDARMNWVRSSPYITAGIVAAAIAIPLALADDDDGPHS
jgi:hypothetical protein